MQTEYSEFWPYPHAELTLAGVHRLAEVTVVGQEGGGQELGGRDKENRNLAPCSYDRDTPFSGPILDIFIFPSTLIFGP